MYKYLTILLIILISRSAFGQKIRVVDQAGKAIENVVVLGENFSTHTNAEGFLNYFPENGTSHLSFVHPNYSRLTLTWDQLNKVEFRVVLTERNTQLQEVIVNPSKRMQALNDVSQKVIAIDKSDVQLFQPQTTADLVGSSGEVFIQKSQMGGGSPMMRGFSANRLLLVVDGVRMNNATYRSGNLQNMISLDVSALDRTEVVFGPGSVIYGSDALGGVIHFYTLKPKLSATKIVSPINVSTRFASANMEKTAHTDFNLAGKKWASLSSISFTDYDDLMMGKWLHDDYQRTHYIKTTDGTDELMLNPKPNRQVYTGYSQLNVMQKIRFRPNDLADFEYAFHFSKTSDIPRYDRLIEYSGEKLKYAEWYYGPQQWIMHSLKGDFIGKGNLYNNLSVTAAFQDFTESRNDRRFGKTTRNVRTENVDIFSLNADADIYFSENQSIFYGLEGLFNKVHSKASEFSLADGTSKSSVTRYPDGSNWWSFGAYAMYNHRLSNITSLQAGTRFNYSGMDGYFDPEVYGFPFDEFENQDAALTINFGMIFNLSEANRIRINGSTGFRAPNIDDAAKVFDSEPGKVIIPNPNLEPENTTTLEAGWLFNPNDKFNFEVTGYFTRLYNAMVRRDGQLNGQDSILYDGQMSKVLMLTNTSWANITGVSTRINYQVNKKLLLNAGINWQTGRDNEDMPVRHVTPIFGDAHVVYRIEKLTIDYYTLFNGSILYNDLAIDERSKPALYAKDDNGNPFSPACFTLNLKSRYALTEKLELAAGIENILDLRYRPYSSGIVAPGLNAIISLNCKF